MSTAVVVVGAAGAVLGELSAGLGSVEAVAVISALVLDALSVGVVVPLLPPQAATRTSRTANPPRYPPKPRLAFRFPVGGISGSESDSGAMDVVTISQSIATQSEPMRIQ